MAVLHRERKEGLGPAYLAGFRRALADGAELILEMDCDFSHDPADVPRLIAACDDGADLALGSRYVPGGVDPELGPRPPRRSRPAATLYARALLSSPVHDLTGGFKCYRRAVLETIDLDAVDSKGYAFQIETTYRAARAGFRVVEVPITFVDREHGGSKMSRTIVLEAAWKVPAAAAGSASRAPVAVPWRNARGRRRDVRGRGARGRQAGRGRLLGALVRRRAARSSRSSPTSRPSMASASASRS